MGVDGSAVQLDDETGRVYYRASSLGQCTRLLVMARLGYDVMEVDREAAAVKPIYDAMQRGKDLEDTVLDLVDGYYDVVMERGDIHVEMDLAGVVLGGHMDGRFEYADGHKVIVEAKTASDTEYNAWLKVYEGTGDPWAYGLFVKYAWQFSVYWACEKADMGVLAVYNRETGDVKYVDVHSPPHTKAALYNRIMVVEGLARDFAVPDTCDTSSFPCPYFYTHTDNREEFDVEMDVVVQALAMTYQNAIAAEKKAGEEKTTAYNALVARLSNGEFVTSAGWKVTKFDLAAWDDEAVEKLVAEAAEAGVEVTVDMVKKKGVRVTVPKDKTTKEKGDDNG